MHSQLINPCRQLAYLFRGLQGVIIASGCGGCDRMQYEKMQNVVHMFSRISYSYLKGTENVSKAEKSRGTCSEADFMSTCNFKNMDHVLVCILFYQSHRKRFHVPCHIYIQICRCIFPAISKKNTNTITNTQKHFWKLSMSMAVVFSPKNAYNCIN